MDRMRRLYQRRGYDGHWVRARHKKSAPQVPLAIVERVLLLYQEKYSHLNARAFHERLRKKHRISLNYSWLAQTLSDAGLAPEKPVHLSRLQGDPAPGEKTFEFVSQFPGRSRSS